VGRLALPPRVSAGFGIALLRLAAGSGTVPLRLSVSAVPGRAGQEDRVPSVTADDVDVCDVDPLTEPNPVVPRPEVPRLVAPRAVAPRPATPALATFGAGFAVAVVEVSEPGDDEEDDEPAEVPELFEELMTPDAVIPELKVLVTPVVPRDDVSPKFEELRIPEPLTEVHGIDASRARGIPDVVELPPIVDRVIPPPSKLGCVAGPTFFVEHCAELVLKSVPNGDVVPMMPGKGALVCAAL
jgi:hypothetical protein